MTQLNPAGETLKQLAARDPDGPVVMINLLRFRERAAYPPDSDDAPCSGREAYRRYGEVAERMIERGGGRVLWMARPELVLVGAEHDRWDEVVLVEYPSARAFLHMLEVPEYRAATRHREAGLADTRLIACTTVFGRFDESGGGG